ncbi:MAG: sigma-70 family RNA polymerase sigma factor, partial [Verrucomicrobiaceae bacterium]
MAPSSIARLYDAFAPSLHRFLLSLTGNEADTRDLLQ